MLKPATVLIVVTLWCAGGAACASKTFVRSSVGAPNERVNKLVESFEDMQAQTARHERRIGELDAKTSNARRHADAAHATARDASNAASAARVRVETVERSVRRLVYDVALEAEEANYRSGQTEPSEAARVRFDDMIHSLMDDPQHVFIEVEGHTDNRGSRAANDAIALARAEAVRRYLHEVHALPLHKINIISFGAERPATSNATENGRARNRRVVIRVRG